MKCLAKSNGGYKEMKSVNIITKAPQVLLKRDNTKEYEAHCAMPLPC